MCDLYRGCPPNAAVIPVDEKTGITARSRKHPDTPGGSGRRTRREFEYVRHGTVSIIAALDVHTGQVLTQTITGNHSETRSSSSRSCWTSRSQVTWTSTWSWTTARPTPRRPDLARDAPEVPTTPPKHASWLNQVEMFFSTLTRRVLRRGQFASRQALTDTIDDFVPQYDTNDAKPYRWTYDGTPLKAA